MSEERKEKEFSVSIDVDVLDRLASEYAFVAMASAGLDSSDEKIAGAVRKAFREGAAKGAISMINAMGEYLVAYLKTFEGDEGQR